MYLVTTEVLPAVSVAVTVISYVFSEVKGIRCSYLPLLTDGLYVSSSTRIAIVTPDRSVTSPFTVMNG